MLLYSALFAIQPLLGCADSEPSEASENEIPAQIVDTDDPVVDSDTEAPEEEDTGAPPADTAEDTAEQPVDTADSAEPEEPEEPEMIVDCAALPKKATSVTEMSGAKGYHGILFDTTGSVFGSDNSSIIEADYFGGWSVFVPGMGYLEQMTWLPSGDMAVSSSMTGKVTQISSAGGSTTLTSDVYAYGLILGPDEMLYAANNTKIFRIDPSDGSKETWLESSAISEGPRVIAFDLDNSHLFVGTIYSGKVYRIPLDNNFDPIAEPELFASGVGSSYHDAIGVDVCGNLYITAYSDSALFRIDPDGNVSTFWDPPFNHHPHGMAWGSDVGGWRLDAVYVTQPYNNNTIAEVVIGVPEKGWEGKVVNGP